ncbi:MAG: hypothetical protein OEV91_05490, partial [Desulfobulbaceae bacterium]|nr:hypothetical protein [Desulfobulbaceae bacterium]
MAEIHPILLAVHTLPHQGRRLLEGKWLIFVDALRNQLRRQGREEEKSGEELLLFNYPHPHVAIAALPEVLALLKKEFAWNEESLGSLPIQMVLHFDKKDEHSAALRDLSASLWDFLRQETLYITRPLKLKWEQLMEGKELPPHTLEREGMGLFRLLLTEKAKHRVTLFPYRELAVLGKKRECFYCGMTNHLPGACPSKLLTMEMRGLADVGFLPFTEMSEIYKEVISKQDQMTTALASGIKPSQIRKNPALLVFVTYFDLFRIYQLRFLHHLAFSTYHKWEHNDKMDRIDIDSRNLHLGLDCLRVGQYGQADKLFSEESVRRDGKHFYTNIGLAFWALDQGRDNDFNTYLQRAVNLASEEKEKIYVNLLLARQSLLGGDKWRAEQALNTIFSIKQDCEEGRYAKVQAMVRGGLGEQAFKELRALAIADRRFFITALMDPTLLPLHGVIEEMLATQIHILTQEAIDHLNRARAGCDELRYWLDEQDPAMQENMQALQGLEKQFERKSYYDILDVIQHSQAIYYTCQQVREEKLEALLAQLDDEETAWRGYSKFWQQYPYRPLFRDFSTILEKIEERFKLVRKMADRKSGEAYRAALKELADLEPEIIRLKLIIKRMVWAKLFLDGLRIFVKNLLITETTLIALVLVSFVGLSTFVADDAGSGLGKVLMDPWFQKQAAFVTTA